jgi:PhzF family phenazine biosynthesis protein
MPGLPTPAFFIVLDDEEKVRKIKPDFTRLIEVSRELDVIGITVTAPGDKEYDYVFRHFAPRAGIYEEQGTGSVHCVLAPYWNEILGKTKMNSIQYSARGSVMEVEVIGDKVLITGAATPLIKGTLSLNIGP